MYRFFQVWVCRRVRLSREAALECRTGRVRWREGALLRVPLPVFVRLAAAAGPIRIRVYW